MTRRNRLIILIATCVLAVGGAAGYLARSRSHAAQAERNAPSVAQTSLASVDARPHIVFRNTALGTRYGMVAMVTAADPRGPRAITQTSCDRVYAAVQRIVCLSSTHGIVSTYSARVLNPRMAVVQTLPLAGIPSRTRLSRDARYASTTTFIAGDSYAGTSFSTRTVITKVGGGTLGSLEKFTLIHAGQAISPTDRNYWGVTFAADGDSFYVTVAWSGHTWLARGSLSKRTVTTMREDAECPSLSPDEAHIVYKQRGALPPGQWRLVELDIATGAVTPLAETRSVDDQVEWLDNSHVMYGLPRAGSQAAVDDVWSVPADGTGTPTVLIPQAWSPAVVR